MRLAASQVKRCRQHAGLNFERLCREAICHADAWGRQQTGKLQSGKLQTSKSGADDSKFILRAQGAQN